MKTNPRSLPRSRSRRFLAGAAALVLAGAASGSAWAADAFPTKPVRLLVPFSAGGGIDQLARITAQKLGEVLGQTVYVDNQAGGGGVIAGRTVANAPADGYTLIFNSASSAVLNLQSPASLGYDPQRDFAPVSLVAQFPLVLLTHPQVSAKTLPEFVAMVKADPGRYSYGSSGAGTAIHLATELFLSQAGITMQHIPYKGTSAALADLLGGRIELLMDGVPPEVGNIAAGKVRPLAVTTAKRSPNIPTVPTMQESGFAGYDLPFWVAIYAPGKTPPAIVRQLSESIAKALKDPATQARLKEAGAEGIGSTPEQLDRFARDQSNLYSNAAKAAKFDLNKP